VSITLLLIKRTHQANIDKRATAGYNSSLHIVLVGWGDTVYWQENAGSNNPPLKGLFSAVQRGGELGERL
jgi:hypothetical protein